MASGDTTPVLDEARTGAVKLMLSELDDHDVTMIFEMVGGIGPIGDRAAGAMKDRNMDL